MGLWPAESDENSFRQKLHSGSAPLPFVTSTGAQRSGEICGSAVPRGNVFWFLQLIAHQAGSEKTVARIEPVKSANKISMGKPFCRARVEDTFML
jgi:hypothetical protein